MMLTTFLSNSLDFRQVYIKNIEFFSQSSTLDKQAKLLPSSFAYITSASLELFFPDNITLT